MDRSKFKYNTFFQYLLQIAKYIFPFITVPYLTRVLGPDVYAIRAYILAVMTIMQVFLDFGFTAYGTKAIAQAKNDLALIKTETSAIMMLRFALCLIGAAALLPACALITILNANILYVFIAYIGVCLTALLPDFIFQGQEDMSIITKRYVASQVISIFLIFFLIHSSEDILLVPIIETIATAIGLIWSWHNVVVVKQIFLVKVSLLKFKKVFMETSIFFLSSASTVLFSSLTTILIGIYINDEALISYWSIAISVISAVQSLYTPIANSLYPHMVKRKDIKLTKFLLIAGTIAALIGAFGFAYLSDFIMLIIGGGEYVEGSYILVLLSPLLFLSYPAIILGYPVLAAVDKTSLLTISSIISSVFHIIGLIVLLLTNNFNIISISLLRCLTEFVLVFFRVVFSFRTLSSEN